MARHLAPFSCRQTMAESVRRRSWGGVLPLGRHASISGSSLIHCASVSIAPPHPRGAKRPSSQPVQARTGPKGRWYYLHLSAASRVASCTEFTKQQEVVKPIRGLRNSRKAQNTRAAFPL